RVRIHAARTCRRRSAARDQLLQELRERLAPPPAFAVSKRSPPPQQQPAALQPKARTAAKHFLSVVHKRPTRLRTSVASRPWPAWPNSLSIFLERIFPA